MGTVSPHDNAIPDQLTCRNANPSHEFLHEYFLPCQTSKTRVRARLEIRTGRLAHTACERPVCSVPYVASRRARAVRAKYRLAGLTIFFPDSEIAGAHRDSSGNDSRDVKLPCAHGPSRAAYSMLPM